MEDGSASAAAWPTQDGRCTRLLVTLPMELAALSFRGPAGPPVEVAFAQPPGLEPVGTIPASQLSAWSEQLADAVDSCTAKTQPWWRPLHRRRLARRYPQLQLQLFVQLDEQGQLWRTEVLSPPWDEPEIDACLVARARSLVPGNDAEQGLGVLFLAPARTLRDQPHQQP